MWTRPSPSVFAYCKQSKTGRWELGRPGNEASCMCCMYNFILQAQWHHCTDIIALTSLQWHHCTDIIALTSCTDIIALTSLHWHHCTNDVSGDSFTYVTLQAILSLCYSVQYILLGAEEGLFSLLVTNNPDPVMEQVSPGYAYTLQL